MANDQSSHLGIRPFVQPGERVRINYYKAGTGANLFMFQPVAKNAVNKIVPAPVGIAKSGILGVIVGFLDPNRGGLPTNLTDLNQGAFLDSGNEALVAVSDDPDQLYYAEEDTGGTLIGSQDSAGQTVHFTYLGSGSGNTTTGISTALMDRSTLATGTGGVFTIIRPYDEIVNSDGTYNDVSGNFAKWILKINSHQNGPVSTYIPTDRVAA